MNMLRVITKSLFLLVLTIFLSGNLGLVQPGEAAAAPKPAVSTIGIVNYDTLIDMHPDMPAANKALQAESEQAQQEFSTKSPGLNDNEKQELNRQLLQRLEQKRQELLSAIIDKIDAAVREVAGAKGLSAVAHKSAAVYGGQDITNDVMKKITKGN